MSARVRLTLPRLVLVLLALSLGTASAQLGVDLGPSGSIDAAIVDVPADAVPVAATLRTERRDTITALALQRGARGLEISGPLPDLSASPLLLAIDAEALWPCPPSVSDPQARFTPAEVAVDGLGVLQPGLQPPLWGDAPIGHVMLVLAFVDRDVRVQVACDPPDDEPGMPLRADLQLAAGWNVMSSSAVVSDAVTLIRLRTAGADELAAARWYAPPVQPAPLPQHQRDDRAPDVRHEEAPPARQD